MKKRFTEEQIVAHLPDGQDVRDPPEGSGGPGVDGSPAGDLRPRPGRRTASGGPLRRLAGAAGVDSVALTEPPQVVF